jgi:hypothetical protein
VAGGRFVALTKLGQDLLLPHLPSGFVPFYADVLIHRAAAVHGGLVAQSFGARNWQSVWTLAGIGLPSEQLANFL